MKAFEFIPSVLLFMCLFGLTNSNKALPASVTVASGEGFLIRLALAGDVPLQNCQLTRNNKLYLLSPGLNQSHDLSTGESVYPFDYNNTYECGIRALNAQKASEGTWKLTSIDENGTEVSGISTVTVLKEEDWCPEQTQNCKITDLITKDEFSCNKQNLTGTIYQCQYFAKGQMSLKTIVEKKNAPQPHDPYQVTRLGSTILECRNQTTPNSLKGCVVQHVPSKRNFSVTEGLQDIRYSAYKSDFAKGICQFEIPEEIKDDDVGIWTMTIETEFKGYEYDNYYDNRYVTRSWFKTCKFHLRGNKTLEKEKIVNRTQTTVVVKMIEDLVKIQCAKDVYYPINVCYLVLKDDIIFAEDYSALADGNCEFWVPAGNWTCGFNGPSDGDTDFEQKFQVIQYKSEIVDEALNVVENGSVSMECHLIEKQPIKFCMFVSPSGKVYRPSSDTYKSKDYSFYKGGEMATGDCGVEFSKEFSKTVESGDWKCVIVKTNDERLTAIIKKKEQAQVSLDDNWL